MVGEEYSDCAARKAVLDVETAKVDGSRHAWAKAWAGEQQEAQLERLQALLSFTGRLMRGEERKREPPPQ